MIQSKSRKKILDLVNTPKEDLKSGTLENEPYLDELMEEAVNVRRIELTQ